MSGSVPELEGLVQQHVEEVGKQILKQTFAEDGQEKPTDNSHLVLKERQTSTAIATFDSSSFNEVEEMKQLEKIKEDVQKDSAEVSTLKERLTNAEQTLKHHQQ